MGTGGPGPGTGHGRKALIHAHTDHYDLPTSSTPHLHAQQSLYTCAWCCGAPLSRTVKGPVHMRQAPLAVPEVLSVRLLLQSHTRAGTRATHIIDPCYCHALVEKARICIRAHHGGQVTHQPFHHLLVERPIAAVAGQHEGRPSLDKGPAIGVALGLALGLHMAFGKDSHMSRVRSIALSRHVILWTHVTPCSTTACAGGQTHLRYSPESSDQALGALAARLGAAAPPRHRPDRPPAPGLRARCRPQHPACPYPAPVQPPPQLQVPAGLRPAPPDPCRRRRQLRPHPQRRGARCPDPARGVPGSGA